VVSHVTRKCIDLQGSGTKYPVTKYPVQKYPVTKYPVTQRHIPEKRIAEVYQYLTRKVEESFE
jgi:hypothetical protein